MTISCDDPCMEEPVAKHPSVRKFTFKVLRKNALELHWIVKLLQYLGACRIPPQGRHFKAVDIVALFFICLRIIVLRSLASL